jgi:YhcH/YjgK/YiaL family protein
MPNLYTRRSFQGLCASLLFAPGLVSAPAEPVTDQLDNWTKHPELKKYAAAFEYLKKTDFRSKEPGRVDLDGNRMYATLSANKARPVESAKFEAHRKYLDIHYLVAGSETIGSASASSLQVVDPYKEEGDIAFYEVPANYRKIEMKPGQFALFLPGQAHLPGIGDASAVIRKVVIKVRV